MKKSIVWALSVGLASVGFAEGVHIAARATGPGGLLRFDGGTAAAEVSCDTTEAVTLSAEAQEGYAFYRWIGYTEDLPEGAVSNATLQLTANASRSLRAVFLRKTGSGSATFIAEPADYASWFDAANWEGGELPVAGDAVTVKPTGALVRNILLDAPTPRYKSLTIDHDAGVNGGCDVTMTNWTTRLEADAITLGGRATLTCAGPFGENEMSNRVWIVCGDLTLEKAQRIWVGNTTWRNFGDIIARNKGYKKGCGPGTARGGGSHGGSGACKTTVDINNVSLSALPYGNAEWPLTPGSGGNLSEGGGVITIEASGTITINTSNSGYPRLITASATSGDRANGKGHGAGGSIAIRCKHLVSTCCQIVANGSTGRTNWQTTEQACDLSLPGGGGRIAIHYDAAAQKTTDLSQTEITVEGGYLNCQFKDDLKNLANFRSPTIADRFNQDADMGTVWFTDETLLKSVLGKTLCGEVVHPVGPALSGLVFTAGHVRFPLDGATMTIAGDLAISGACTRVEFGGSETTNGIVRGTYLRTQHPWTLNVEGNLTLGDGARLDIRSALTNDEQEAGCFVKVRGQIDVGGYTNNFATVKNIVTDLTKTTGQILDDQYRVTNTSVVVWSDGFTGCAPKIEAGDVRVASNACITAYRRGYFGGGKLTDVGITDYSVYGYGPVVSNAVTAKAVLTWFGGGDSMGGVSYGGGGHGGIGGFWQAKSVYRGQPYDSALRPALAGAGGGGLYRAEATLPGGGVIRIAATNLVQVDGLICADGASSVPGENKGYPFGLGGAGAGGTICIDCRRFIGAKTGVLTARGGSIDSPTASTGRRYGCGGGGRIAVWTGRAYEPGQRTRRCTIGESLETYLGAATAAGGRSNLTDNDNALDGADGTVRFAFNPNKGGLSVIVR